MFLLSLVTAVLCLVRSGRAFPRGAPAEACESLLPRHYGTESQDPENSPYSFLASDNHYHYSMKEGIQGTVPPIKDLPVFKFPQNVPKPRINKNFISTVKKSFFSTALAKNITDSEKLNPKRMLSKRFSKSDGDLNLALSVKKAYNKRLEYLPTRKRSSSENDLRIKKKIYATTPMCLKRTIQNVKSRTLKSTEELEMEKIAELQKKMREHLRANENTMKRQKMKRNGNFQKELIGTKKKEKMLPSKKSQQDYNSVMEKINAYANRARTQTQKAEFVPKAPSSLYSDTSKKTSIPKKVTLASSDRLFQDFMKPTTSQQTSEIAFGKMSISSVLKELPVNLADAHRGLVFTSSHRKPAIRPFNFQDMSSNTIIRSISKTESGSKFKTEPSNLMHTPRLVRNKENGPVVKNALFMKRNWKNVNAKEN